MSSTPKPKAFCLAMEAKFIIFRAQDAAAELDVPLRADVEKRLARIRAELEALDRMAARLRTA